MDRGDGPRPSSFCLGFQERGPLKNVVLCAINGPMEMLMPQDMVPGGQESCGQGWLTKAALLLDEMNDAGPLPTLSSFLLERQPAYNNRARGRNSPPGGSGWKA